MTQPPIERPWDAPQPPSKPPSGLGKWLDDHKGVVAVGLLVIVGIALLVNVITSKNAPSGNHSDGSQPMTISQAFCSDLAKGYTPMNILGGQVKNGTLAPSEAADKAYGWAAISCPGQLQSNQALRAYLQNWGIDPDA